MDLLDQIPGYREAIENETRAREEAFIDSPEFICGIEVLPLTLQRYALLNGIGSPFLCAVREPDATDMALFLWVLSPQYDRAMRLRGALEMLSARLGALAFWWVRYRFIRRLRQLNAMKLRRAIQAYLDAAFLDAPGGGGKQRAAGYWSVLAKLIADIASEFNWSEQEIGNVRLSRLWQYYRILQKRHNSDLILFNPSDRIRGAWLAAQQPQKRKAKLS